MRYRFALTVFLALFVLFGCGGDSSDEVDPLLLKSFVQRVGQEAKSTISAAARKVGVPTGLLFDEIHSSTYHVWKSQVADVPIADVQQLCEVIQSITEEFRNTVKPQLTLGVQTVIIVPDDPEHVSYVKASRLYLDYLQEFRRAENGCESIITNKRLGH